jgi:tight adherence protein B
MYGPYYYLFAILLFVAVVLLVEGAYVWWNNTKGPEAKRIERRLRAMSAGAHDGARSYSILKERLLAQSPPVHRFLLGVPRVHVVDRLLEQSGLSWSVARFLLLTLAAGLAGALVGRLVGLPVLITTLLVLFLAALPILHVLDRKRKRLYQIDQQLPDALEMMSRALRAGHAFPSALKMVGDEMSDPIAAEFRTAFDEVNYGVALQDALVNLATRVPITDFRYFIIAVLIQRETGGNLAELLNSIAQIIRGRHKIAGTIRVLSAEGRLSAWILCVLPFALAVLLYILNPEFVSLLWTDSNGIKLLTAGVILMVIGIYWMRNVIRIRV